MRNKTLTIALAMIMTLAAAAQCFAAGEYQYKMKVSAGNNGKISGETEYAVEPGGAFPTLGTNAVSVTNSKYVVAGFKEVGRDEVMQEIPPVSKNKASEDLSYVAVYASPNQLVEYTVSYLDAAGNKLMQDATYYGPKGSSVMVSFKYIDGYAPTAYNLSKTLSESSSDNVLAFRYYESDITAEDQQAAADNAGNAGNANAGAANANAGANQAAAQAAAIDAANPGTPEVVNLDNEDVPLAGPDGTEGEPAGEINDVNYALIAGAAAVLIAAIAAVIVFMRRRNNEYEFEEDE